MAETGGCTLARKDKRSEEDQMADQILEDIQVVKDRDSPGLMEYTIESTEIRTSSGLFWRCTTEALKDEAKRGCLNFPCKALLEHPCFLPVIPFNFVTGAGCGGQIPDVASERHRDLDCCRAPSARQICSEEWRFLLFCRCQHRQFGRCRYSLGNAHIVRK